jgi:hypothetical protein
LRRAFPPSRVLPPRTSPMLNVQGTQGMGFNTE